ncbi:MAG: hypothetical protein ACI8RZ_002040, partial [Myxococcota bacterium]
PRVRSSSVQTSYWKPSSATHSAIFSESSKPTATMETPSAVNSSYRSRYPQPSIVQP